MWRADRRRRPLVGGVSLFFQAGPCLRVLLRSPEVLSNFLNEATAAHHLCKVATVARWTQPTPLKPAIRKKDIDLKVIREYTQPPIVKEPA
jgi:hypothetical protein